MKKTALLAACNPNYGSLLQSYALQQYLHRSGVQTEIIVYTHRPLSRQLVRLFNLPLLKMKSKMVARDLRCRIFRPGLHALMQQRLGKFREFRDQRLVFSQERYPDRTALERGTGHYAAFILGSDQVWNPINLGTDFYTLNFVPDQMLKITYAPSFGVARIPSSQVRRTKHYLDRIDHISVREKSGQEIVREITGREVPVVCDPTMLVDRELWDELKGDRPVVEGKYIFCYFLGNRKDIRDFADRVKAETGLRIVALQHLDEFVRSDCAFGDIRPYDIGPAEFVNLVSHAEIVLTDSFHGTIFSILYERPFFSFGRFAASRPKSESTNSRIDSILGTIGLADRKLAGNEEAAPCLARTIDYGPVRARLQDYRASSRAYLERVIALIPRSE
ncbi:MAG: polysaccharide pyruvyl transferase family protein [Rikenellaceae bacterium]|nr:polysaccharide pyruvyl transferase family protein [Rikenellaceae bacterium]